MIIRANMQQVADIVAALPEDAVLIVDGVWRVVRAGGEPADEFWIEYGPVVRRVSGGDGVVQALEAMTTMQQLVVGQVQPLRDAVYWDAMLDGREAARRGEPVSACPYGQEMDERADAWRLGWLHP